ncbi:MAG: STAS domain-containing protein [Bdellovibrionota bacterium]
MGHLPAFLRKYELTILQEWMHDQTQALGAKIKAQDLKNHCEQFLRLLIEALQLGNTHAQVGGPWDSVRKLLAEISKTRGLQGCTPSETATFVFSLKKPLFNLLRKELEGRPQEFANESWRTTETLDKLGLYTTEMYQKSRDEIISRQQEEMLELSTPVVKLWDGILALPMIGTLDSNRTQVVMESLLEKIMETGSEVAIIDITGVPTVDTLVAQHLIKTVTAARLMGAECIISGIRPQIAATIVHLGVELGNIATKATLADAFILALSRTGKNIGRQALPTREVRA